MRTFWNDSTVMLPWRMAAPKSRLPSSLMRRATMRVGMAHSGVKTSATTVNFQLIISIAPKRQIMTLGSFTRSERPRRRKVLMTVPSASMRLMISAVVIFWRNRAKRC
ncbi:MAG: hypothetical protein WDO13_12240 [Verrucomicrobiota bacterium]